MAKFIFILSLLLLELPALPARLEGSGNPESIRATITRIEERPSQVFCSCNNIEGRELVFDLTLENLEETPLTVFVFIWVANDDVAPPERALWPSGAVESSLTIEGNLAVEDPRVGQRMDLGAGEIREVTGNVLPEPIGWYEGKLVRFTRLRFLVLDINGGTISESWTDLEKPVP